MVTHTHCDKCGKECGIAVMHITLECKAHDHGPNEQLEYCRDCAIELLPDIKKDYYKKRFHINGEKF